MSFDYPVTLDLTGRRCVVIGGTALAGQRARALLAAGAAVTVVAEDVTAGLDDLARSGQLTLVRRSYTEGDLAGAFLAVAAVPVGGRPPAAGAGTDSDLNARIYAEAEAAGVLLNAVDDNPHCHFALPAVVRRGALSVAVSTGGHSPALAKRIRRDLDAQFGPEYATLVALVGDVRRQLQDERRRGTGAVPDDFETWSSRWEEALAADLAGLVRGGHLEAARDLVYRTLTAEHREEAVA